MKQHKALQVLSALVEGSTIDEVLADELDEADDSDADGESKVPVAVDAAASLAQKARYLRELTQRMGRLRQYIVHLPVWSEKVKLRQQQLERWTRVRHHTLVKITPLPSNATASSQAQAAVTKIQVATCCAVARC